MVDIGTGDLPSVESIIGDKLPFGLAFKKAAKVSADSPRCLNEGVTDAGIVKSAKWKAIINGAMLVANVANGIRIASLQRELSKLYLKMAQQQRGYYNEKYKPLEIDTINEVMGIPLYKRKDSFHAGQAVLSVRGAVAGKLSQAMSCTGRYCTGTRAKILNDMLTEQVAMELSAEQFAHRYNDREEITMNNLRWEKREQLLKLGRNLPAEVSSYASLASGVFSSLGDQIGKASEGMAGFLGYVLNRGDTQYPPRHGDINVPSYTYKPNPITPLDGTPIRPYREEVIKLSG